MRRGTQGHVLRVRAGGAEVVQRVERSRERSGNVASAYSMALVLSVGEFGVMTEVSRKSTLSENQRSIMDLHKRTFLHGNAK